MHRLLSTARNFAAFAALLLTFAATPRAHAQVWQASTDFSTVQGYRNWRYMTYVSGTYELMVYGQNGYGFDSWHTRPFNGDFITSGGMHPPGPGGPQPARIWESPVAGTVRVTGRVAQWDGSPRNPAFPSDGVRATIWKNGELKYSADIADLDLAGYDYDLSVHVMPGDWLIFRVEPLSTNYYDSTYFDPRIAVESLDSSGQTYDLASNWSLAANPNGAWTHGRMDGSLNFTPFTSTVDAAYLGDFFGEQPSWDGGYPMVLGKSTGTCFHDFPLNRIGGHTSNDDNTNMAVRWTAPTAGNYDISGGAWMFREIGREAILSLYVNGVALFDDVLIPAPSAGYNSGATFSLGAAMIADGRLASELLQIPLEAGDTVTLAVRKTAASDYGDYVGLDLTLQTDAPLWIANVLTDLSAYAAGLELSFFEGQNDNSRAARRLSLSHELKIASNRVASGETTAAVNLLLNVIVRLQGTSPPDWMVDGPEKQALREDIWQLIYLLGGP